MHTETTSSEQNGSSRPRSPSFFGMFLQRRATLDGTCPFHAALESLESICIALGLRDISQLENEGVPLIGRRDDARTPVEKRHFINEAQRHARIACTMLEYVEIDDNNNITGHFMLKELARKGSTFTTIQWFARHSSSVTWSYIEESWGECPEHALKLKDEMALTEVVSNTLARVRSIEEAVEVQAGSMRAPGEGCSFV